MKAFNMFFIYLDLNHFINLAQGVKRGTPSLFDRLKLLVDEKRAVIPASGPLIMEVQGIKHPRQRADIGNIIKRLCNQFVIRDYANILQMEITNKVAEHYGDARRFSLPVIAFAIGYLEAFGHLKLKFSESAELDQKRLAGAQAEIREYLAGDEPFDQVLDNVFVPKLADGGPEHQAFIKATESVREENKKLAFQQFREAYTMNMLDIVQREFDNAATDLGILVNGLHPLMPPAFRTPQFLESIPTLNMWSEMHLYLYHKNLQSNAEINDMYDMAHLSVAVPYCDVVACDKKMESALVQSKLAQKYQTTVFSNLSETLDHLEAES